MALLFANNSSLSSITALPSGISGGGLNLIKEQTASSSASISFVNGVDGVVLDGTYKEYIFKFINIHPATDASVFEFNLSTDSGSNYNVIKTTTFFYAQHYENDASTEFGYDTGQDLAQSTSYQRLGLSIGSDNDQSGSGYLHLFNPSSNTYVKHFMASFGTVRSDDLQTDVHTAGYANTVSAINSIDFKFHNASNIDDGIIKLYGVS